MQNFISNTIKQSRQQKKQKDHKIWEDIAEEKKSTFKALASRAKNFRSYPPSLYKTVPPLLFLY